MAAAYREQFGFPLDRLRPGDRTLRPGAAQRLGADGQSPAVEKAAALIEIAKIANYRFDDLVADANPIAAARVAHYEEADR